MKKKYIVTLAVVLTLIGSGLYARHYFENKKYNRVNPLVGEITEAVYSLGKVKSNQRYEIKIGITSTIQKLFVHEGDNVLKDQNLLELDSKALFKAPFAGTVTLLSVNEGETVSPQMVLLKLENLKDRYIELTLEQEGALRIKKDQITKISFESLRGKVLSGKITSIFPKEDNFLANVEVSDLNDSVLPGMSADVAIEIGKITGTLVPLKAVRNGTLTIERDGKIQKIKVEVGLSDGISAEIKNSDLKQTDAVLVPKD